MQDRDGGPGVIRQACDSFPTLACIFADAGYSGDKLQTAVEAFDGPKIEIVKRPQGVTGFVVVTRDGWSSAPRLARTPQAGKGLGDICIHTSMDTHRSPSVDQCAMSQDKPQMNYESDS